MGSSATNEQVSPCLVLLVSHMSLCNYTQMQTSSAVLTQPATNKYNIDYRYLLNTFTNEYQVSEINLASNDRGEEKKAESYEVHRPGAWESGQLTATWKDCSGPIKRSQLTLQQLFLFNHILTLFSSVDRAKKAVDLAKWKHWLKTG